MKLNLALMGIIIVLFSSFVLASNAPPPIPAEYFGRVTVDNEIAPDGTVIGYFNGEEWINTTTINGWYNLILTGGDSDLTFLDDTDCSTHWANDEACIPCSTNQAHPDYCIEGPKEGDIITIHISDNLFITKGGSVEWQKGIQEINIEASIYPDIHRFYIKNNVGEPVAWFGNFGNVVLKGDLEENSAHTQTPNDEFIFRIGGNDVMIIDTTNGNMYIDGTLFENQNTLTPSEQSDDFIIRNSNKEVVAYVNEVGNVFLKGELYENSNP